MLFKKASSKLRILFITNAHNSMSQRAWLDLTKQQHKVSVELATSQQAMLAAKNKYQPDVILCPMLTSKVPKEIYLDKKVPCWIIHPGVQGDRGMSSIDWALKNKLDRWGVTVLQADEEMDAGAIWSSKTFPVQRQDQRTITKSSLYKNEVIQTAMSCLDEALDKYYKNIAPMPLDYNSPDAIGQLNETMKQQERMISWEDNVDQIVHNIRFSDSQPGVKVKLHGDSYFAYNAYEEHCQIEHKCGEIVGHRDGAIAVAAKDGLVWIATLKNSCNKIKLPAIQALPQHIRGQLKSLQPQSVELDNFQNPLSLPANSYQEIWTCTQNDICYVHFNFSNGACSTDQCRRLENVLSRISNDKTIKGVVLMGGYDTFSNGIHLNVVENAQDPFQESVENINAIDNVIKAVVGMTDKVTISALQGSAGAGGVMMAAAADRVLTHESLVLNPHYRLMGLYGSEYWTYFLPQRVGKQQALNLTEGKMPISAQQAKNINLVDKLLGKNVEEFRHLLVNEAENIVHQKGQYDDILSIKKNRNADWFANIEQHRKTELSIMEKNFQNTEYNHTRKNFVKKIKPLTTPAHMPGFLPREINVAQVNNRVIKEIKTMVEELQQNSGELPRVCFLTDSKNCLSKDLHDQMKACKQMGFRYTVIHLNSVDNEEELKEALLYYMKEMCPNGQIDAILTSQSSLSSSSVAHITSHFTDFKVPMSLEGQAIVRLLLEYGVQLFDNTVTIISDDKTNDLSLANYFELEGANVLVGNSNDPDLKTLVQQADVTVATNGIPKSVNAQWFKKGSAVVNYASSKAHSVVNTNSSASLYVNTSECMEHLAFSTLLQNVVQHKANKMKACATEEETKAAKQVQQ